MAGMQGDGGWPCCGISETGLRGFHGAEIGSWAEWEGYLKEAISFIGSGAL